MKDYYQIPTRLSSKSIVDYKGKPHYVNYVSILPDKNDLISIEVSLTELEVLGSMFSIYLKPEEVFKVLTIEKVYLEKNQK